MFLVFFLHDDWGGGPVILILVRNEGGGLVLGVLLVTFLVAVILNFARAVEGF